MGISHPGSELDYGSKMSSLRTLLLIIVGGLVLSWSMSNTLASDEPVHAEKEAAHGEQHHETGAPLSPRQDAVVWSTITFVVFLIVLKKAAWGPMIDGLNKREAHYAKLLADAEHDRDAATKLLGEYETKLKAAQGQVDAIIAEARRDADHTKQEIIAVAQKEADTTRQRVTEELNRAKDQAINELFVHMRGNVLAATERVLARSLTDADHQRLIDEALAEVRRN